VTDIFSEVEEEVRKERWELLWKRYGNYVIAVAAAIIVGVGGYQAWEVYDLNRRNAASDSFNGALLAAQGGNLIQAETDFAAITADGPGGYALLSEFQAVRVELEQGKREEAIIRLRRLIDNADPMVNSPARLHLAWVIADTAPRDETETLIAPLEAADNPWRYVAAEISAYLDYRAGDWQAAAASYQALSIDPGTPQGTRQRAGWITQFLRANTQEATNDAAAPGIAGEPQTPAEPVQEDSPQ
jgi:hypothetical protein